MALLLDGLIGFFLLLDNLFEQVSSSRIVRVKLHFMRSGLNETASQCLLTLYMVSKWDLFPLNHLRRLFIQIIRELVAFLCPFCFSIMWTPLLDSFLTIEFVVFCFLGIRDCLLHFCSTPPVCHFCERFRMCFDCYWFMPWNTPITERAKLHQGAKLDVRKWFGKMWTNLHCNGEFVPLHKSLRILTFIISLQKNSFF